MGLIGVGHGGAELIPRFEESDQVDLVAAADTNPAHLQMLQSVHPEVRVYDSAERLCADPDVDAVWVATPNNLHFTHAMLAARAGKHVVTHKPMGTSLREATKLVETAEANGVHIMVGGLLSHSGPVQGMRRLIASGELGELRALHSFAYTDWMLLPRVPEEVDVERGGGVVNRQAPHQIDSIRLIGGGMLRSVRGYVGQWSGVRPCPGYFAGFFEFQDGSSASIVYDAYGYFTTAELVPWAGDRGIGGANAETRAGIRSGLLDGSGLQAELERKRAIRLGDAQFMERQRSTEKKPWVPGHLGIIVASCERGDIRQSAQGLFVYDDNGNREVPLDDWTFHVGREELAELYDAVIDGKPLPHGGAWSLATMEAHFGLIESAKRGREIKLTHQVPVATN